MNLAINLDIGFEIKQYKDIKSVDEWHAITLACTHTGQYIFGCVIVARAKIYMKI